MNSAKATFVGRLYYLRSQCCLCGRIFHLVKPPSVLFRRRDAHFVMSSESRDISHYHLLKIRDSSTALGMTKRALTSRRGSIMVAASHSVPYAILKVSSVSEKRPTIH